MLAVTVSEVNEKPLFSRPLRERVRVRGITFFTLALILSPQGELVSNVILREDKDRRIRLFKGGIGSFAPLRMT
jgi:hypothetical protein